VHRDDGTDVWQFRDTVIPNAALNAVAGRPKEEYGLEPQGLDEIRPGCYDVHERVKDMNAGGILASMNFPSFPGFAARLFATDDPDFSLALVRAYNDWHIEEWCGAELVARPLLSLWWPELADVVQPLAGEWAARRDLMASLPVPVGYGIELAVLLDTARRHGLDSVAQVDLGRRGHRHQASHDLAVMAAELLAVAERRRPPPRRLITQAVLQQFVRAEGGGVQRRSRPVPTHERPPVRSLPAGEPAEAGEAAGIAGTTW
jgi:hypothetical protein